MTRKEVCPGTKSGATTNATATAATTKDTAAATDYDIDKSMVSKINKDLWAAIFDGDFRLGVKCKRCGRWLYAGRSKRRGYGARCAAHLAEAVTDA